MAEHDALAACHHHVTFVLSAQNAATVPNPPIPVLDQPNRGSNARRIAGRTSEFDTPVFAVKVTCMYFGFSWLSICICCLHGAVDAHHTVHARLDQHVRGLLPTDLTGPLRVQLSIYLLIQIPQMTETSSETLDVFTAFTRQSDPSFAVGVLCGHLSPPASLDRCASKWIRCVPKVKIVAVGDSQVLVIGPSSSCIQNLFQVNLRHQAVHSQLVGIQAPLSQPLCSTTCSDVDATFRCCSSPI